MSQKYITTNLANQIKLKLEKKVCKQKNKYFYRVNNNRKNKHIHLLHKISSLYIPLYKNVKAKQTKNREINSYNYLYLYGQEEEEKMQKITKIK